MKHTINECNCKQLIINRYLLQIQKFLNHLLKRYILNRFIFRNYLRKREGLIGNFPQLFEQLQTENPSFYTFNRFVDMLY